LKQNLDALEIELSDDEFESLRWDENRSTRLPWRELEAGAGRPPSGSARRFPLVIRLAFEQFLALALVVPVPLVLLRAQKRGLVLMLLVWFTFAHHRSFL
jgi:hypothetical protein